MQRGKEREREREERERRERERREEKWTFGGKEHTYKVLSYILG